MAHSDLMTRTALAQCYKCYVQTRRKYLLPTVGLLHTIATVVQLNSNTNHTTCWKLLSALLSLTANLFLLQCFSHIYLE